MGRRTIDQYEFTCDGCNASVKNNILPNKWVELFGYVKFGYMVIHPEPDPDPQYGTVTPPTKGEGQKIIDEDDPITICPDCLGSPKNILLAIGYDEECKRWEKDTTSGYAFRRYA